MEMRPGGHGDRRPCLGKRLTVRVLVHSSYLARDLIISIINPGLPELAGMSNASQFSMGFAMVVREAG